MFLRLLGASLPCSGGHSCPAILELVGGDYAVIGTDITTEGAPSLPAGAGCGPSEKIVRIPRAILLNAKKDIPS